MAEKDMHGPDGVYNGPDGTYCDQCEKAVYENYMEYCKTCGNTVCCDCYDMKKDMCKNCVE